MTRAAIAPGRPPRVAITRDEDAGGPLSQALRAHGFDPHPLPIAIEAPSADATALRAAASRFDRYDWVVCASVRAVAALSAARDGEPWPHGVRSAAVGRATAQALAELGADPPPLIADESGAAGLLEVLTAADAPAVRAGQRVLALTVAGGRRTLIDGLREAGAEVDEVEAYRMVARALAEVSAAWREIDPTALIVTSPSAARGLVAAIGARALASVGAVVAIGPTTASALADFDLRADIAPRPEFPAVAAHLAAIVAARRDR